MLSKEDFVRACGHREMIDDFLNKMKNEFGLDLTECYPIQSSWWLFDIIIDSHFSKEQADFIYNKLFEDNRKDYRCIYDEVLNYEKVYN